jgi:protein-S-isoprenylcysteine O-methyltransferase Ste14
MSRFVLALKTFVFPAIIGAILFAAAGRFDLPFFWGVLAVLTVLYLGVALAADPGMVKERLAPGPGNQDRITQPLGGLALVTHWVLTGLDVGRFEWSLIPREIQGAGLVGFILALTFLFWAMRSNPFYSSVVRVQADRGQHPVVAGPYRFVRHPGYAASLVGMLCGAVALGSWVGVVPVIVFALLFVRRTLLEDRMLQRDLAGYAQYSQRVRFSPRAGRVLTRRSHCYA